MDNQQEGSLQMLHTGGSGYRRRGQAIHEQVDEKAMQQELDDLKKRLHQAQRKQTPSSSNVSSNDEEDASYRQRLGTPHNIFPVRRNILTRGGPRVHLEGE